MFKCPCKSDILTLSADVRQMKAKENVGMKTKKAPLADRSELRTALVVVAAVSLVSMASGRSCIVNAGTETYAQSWGLYDMLGGVAELCNDWYQVDVSGLNGVVNVCLSDPSKLADGETAGSVRVRKGGTWKDNAFVCRPAWRDGVSPGYRGDWAETGMRVKCYMGLR